MKGYVRKVKRRKAEGTRLHRTAEESAGNRNRKKLLRKSTEAGTKMVDILRRTVQDMEQVVD